MIDEEKDLELAQDMDYAQQIENEEPPFVEYDITTYPADYTLSLVQKKDAKTAEILASDGVDLVNTYNNLIECRHQLVHAGMFNMPFDEAVRSYQIGKKLIDVIDETMKR